jgi:hypothetical protein
MVAGTAGCRMRTVGATFPWTCRFRRRACVAVSGIFSLLTTRGTVRIWSSHFVRLESRSYTSCQDQDTSERQLDRFRRQGVVDPTHMPSRYLGALPRSNTKSTPGGRWLPRRSFYAGRLGGCRCIGGRRRDSDRQSPPAEQRHEGHLHR